MIDSIKSGFLKFKFNGENNLMRHVRNLKINKYIKFTSTKTILNPELK